ncbi:MAG TPA: alpha/beta hydrolase, partial [Allosphingosinicella sp.]|nr:alpha/beta hydrolase [Allosphingosinicella sp.]
FDGHMAGALSSAASAVANAGARTLIDGSDFGDNLLAALPDVIGSTIGNMIAGAVQGSGSRSKPDEIAEGRQREPYPGADAYDGDGTVDRFEEWDSGRNWTGGSLILDPSEFRLDSEGQWLGGARLQLASQEGWVNPDEDPRLGGRRPTRPNLLDEDPSVDPRELMDPSRYTRGLRPGQPISVSAANLLQTMWWLNSDKPIFIGGGGDGYTFGLTNIVGPYARNREGGGNFLLHSSYEQGRAAIEVAYALHKPIVIVGHSWGAYTAMYLAEYAISRGIRVDLLATMDPVVGGGSLPMTRQQMSRINSGVRDWINVRATGYQTPPGGSGDTIASIGVRMDTGLQRMARHYYEAPVPHAYFEPMMQRGNVEARIREIYAGRRRR